MNTCIVTGASGGIGGAIAEALVKHGYYVLLQGRNANKLNEVKARIGDNCELVIGDLNESSDRVDILEKLFERSHVSLVVNAAGISEFSSFEKMNKTRISDLVATNLVSPILFVQEFIQMKKARNSFNKVSVVNVGSAFGYIGYPGFSVYSATKFGLRGFTESLRREFSDSCFQFAYFAPRATQTDINTTEVDQMNKALGNAVDSPSYVAEQFMHFHLKQLNEATVGWPEKLFVKVNSLLPKVVDKAIRSKLPVIKQYMGV